MNFFLKFFPGKRVYMDYASTTPPLPEVLSAMAGLSADSFANPSSIYKEGLEAKKILAGARERVADVLGVKSFEIVFTGGGTESDNLAILGLAPAMKKEGKAHIVATPIEHPAVLEPLKRLEEDGFKISYLPISKSGVVKAEDVEKAVRPETGLVVAMHANNEIGSIQPIRRIGLLLKNIREKTLSEWPLFHTDSSQAANYLDISPNSLGVDLMALDGSKIYGPKGTGALFVRHSVSLSPIIFGGGQEGGLRSGTENPASAVGFAEAIFIAARDREAESKRLTALREHFFSRLEKELPELSVNGDKKMRLPGNVNVCLPRAGGEKEKTLGEDSRGEFAVIQMDILGIACASVTACRGAKGYYSHVLPAIGRRECAGSSLRFSMGRGTTKRDVDRVVEALKKIIRS